MSTSLRRLFRPVSYGLATTLTGLGGVGLVLWGIVSAVSAGDGIGVGIGVMLALYGAIMGAITWAAWRRYQWAWGLVIAAALLNAFAVGSFLGTDDPVQLAVVVPVFVLILVTGVAGILPSTRLAMQR